MGLISIHNEHMFKNILFELLTYFETLQSEATDNHEKKAVA